MISFGHSTSSPRCESSTRREDGEGEQKQLTEDPESLLSFLEALKEHLGLDALLALFRLLLSHQTLRHFLASPPHVRCRPSFPFVVQFAGEMR